MINQSRNPVEWISLIAELEKARVRLEKLEGQMSAAGETDEASFAAHMRQIYSHLNRAWNARALTHELTREEWSDFSRFPSDLEPFG
jgi:hypothetical protein